MGVLSRKPEKPQPEGIDSSMPVDEPVRPDCEAILVTLLSTGLAFPDAWAFLKKNIKSSKTNHSQDLEPALRVFKDWLGHEQPGKELVKTLDRIEKKVGIREAAAALSCLPEGFHVSGHLFMGGRMYVVDLPAGLRVDGVLDLNGTNLKSLPDNLTVGGCLRIGGCPNLSSLPKGLSAGSIRFIPNTDTEWMEGKECPCCGQNEHLKVLVEGNLDGECLGEDWASVCSSGIDHPFAGDTEWLGPEECPDCGEGWDGNDLSFDNAQDEHETPWDGVVPKDLRITWDRLYTKEHPQGVNVADHLMSLGGAEQ